MRTEIQSAIADLKKLRERLPEFSYFGTNNHLIIDTQLDVIEGRISDEDEIYAIIDEEGIDEIDASVIFDTLNWYNGDEEVNYDDTFKGGFDDL